LIWSRGEELITDRFPEIEEVGRALPDCVVLDGEIMAWKDERPLPFGVLQTRIGRKNLTPRILAEAPAAFIAFDLLEHQGQDIRTLALVDRRQQLAQLARGVPANLALRLSTELVAQDWDDLKRLRDEARSRQVEGVMLKRRDSAYGVGRPKGDWWKWKISPYTIDAVLIYAQRGHGRRASLYTDYTFGVWSAGELVPVAKAYSGLTDEEIREVDRYVRDNTLERFGPVRAVRPELVFELHFEGIQISKRHKAGIAVRFPRMARWRHDKKPADADTLQTLVQLAQQPGGTAE
jgi:DNA ligase 1